MRDSTYKFTLDVHDVASQVQIVAKQNDNARKIIANLMENGKPYALDIECRAVFMCKKPDGNVLYNDCDVINKGSAISYDFTNQTTSVTGIHECEIRVYGADDEIITSPRFTILVTPNVYQDGQVTSASEFNALTDIVSDVAAGLATINQAVSDVNDGLDDINDALDREQDILDTADTVLTNATTYATNAQTSATNASASATAAATSETNASTYATNASDSALVSEGYATGTQNGVAVDSTSPYYQNNSKYYKESVENMDIHVDWTKVDNKPTEYTPSAHNHNDLYYGKSDVYQKTETYSKTEVDGMIPTSMDWRNITNTPADYPPSSHNHNDLYYSKTEIDGKKATRDTIGFIKPDNTTTFVDSDGVLSAVGGGGAGSAIWGSISGDITNQTDLSMALSGKANTSHTHTKSEITDFSHTHTKSEITDFAHNHDSDYYKKSETYTQTEIDGMVPGVGTLTDAGILKPDGTTITVDADGTIHGASTYTLPEATASDLGGVKIGSGVNVAADGTISVDAYTLPTASTSTLGGVKVDGSSITINDGVISAVGSGGSDKSTITNLLKPTLASQTVNGVTITNNGDGTHTVNGTASATTIFQLVAAGSITVEQGTYKLVGCPNGGSDSKYKLDIVLTVTDYGSGNVFSVSARTTINYATRIVIYANTVCNNLVFKPMLTTDLSATYDDFVPYTGSTGKLNSDVAEINKLEQSQITPIGIYCYQNVIKKRNGIVQLSINAVVSGSDITQSTQIGTIPEGYRPLETENIAIYDNTSKTTNRLIIGTDGKITVQPNTTLSGSASNIQFNATWII